MLTYFFLVWIAMFQSIQYKNNLCTSPLSAILNHTKESIFSCDICLYIFCTKILYQYTVYPKASLGLQPFLFQLPGLLVLNLVLSWRKCQRGLGHAR